LERRKRPHRRRVHRRLFQPQRRATLSAAPALTIAEVLASLHYKDPAHREHHRESLERAGFPA